MFPVEVIHSWSRLIIQYLHSNMDADCSYTGTIPRMYLLIKQKAVMALLAVQQTGRFKSSRTSSSGERTSVKAHRIPLTFPTGMVCFHVSLQDCRTILGTASQWRWRSPPGRSSGSQMWVCPPVFPSSTAAWSCRARQDSSLALASCSFAPADVWPQGWTSLKDTWAVCCVSREWS